MKVSIKKAIARALIVATGVTVFSALVMALTEQNGEIGALFILCCIALTAGFCSSVIEDQEA